MATFHVVCHSCTFEFIEDAKDDAAEKAAMHSFETEPTHDVEYGRVA